MRRFFLKTARIADEQARRSRHRDEIWIIHRVDKVNAG